MVFKTFILGTFFIVFLLQSCVTTSTPVMRLEGSEFKKNLPGLWEGNWYWAGRSGKRRINIIKIDRNKVELTGYTAGGDYWADTDEVSGHIENSALLLTWPLVGPNGVNDRYTMIRDDTNNLILDGIWRNPSSSGKSQLKKIE
jgi:hypothetical protein